jgi:hypothetical protein
VACLEVIAPFGARPVLMAKLQRDLHLHVAASAGFTIEHGDVASAEITFAMAPNTAGAERDF